MKVLNLFKEGDLIKTLQRVDKLDESTKPQWGKMSAAQMLAHCNVAYEMAFEPKTPKATGIKRWLLRTFVKNQVVGLKPYPKNGQTAPAFKITDERNFETEKQRLVAYLEKSQSLGEAHFHNRESHSFGKLSKEEWNVMFSKHLDHHLTQFGV